MAKSKKDKGAKVSKGKKVTVKKAITFQPDNLLGTYKGIPQDGSKESK